MILIFAPKRKNEKVTYLSCKMKVTNIIPILFALIRDGRKFASPRVTDFRSGWVTPSLQVSPPSQFEKRVLGDVVDFLIFDPKF